MALAQYSDTFWFPSGVLASAVTTRVFPDGSNTLATLWADSAGTIALPNPLNTDALGVLTFWAEAGTYWVHIDTEAFRVDVGMTQEQADLSSGVASGGRITINGANPLAIDITAIDGYVVDFPATGESPPSITRVQTPAQTIALDAGSLARTATWWVLDSAGTVTQQGTPPTNEQRRANIPFGLTILTAGVITSIQHIAVMLYQPANQMVDLMDALGAFSTSGNTITPNGANLQINHSTGLLFARSFNRFDGVGALTRNPHVKQTIAQTPASWRYSLRNTFTFSTPVSLIDPTMYDNAGVLTPVGGGANTSTVQHVWLFGGNTAPEQLAIQYGQRTYSSLSAAAAVATHTGDVSNPLFVGSGAVIASIAMVRTATNLSDPSQALFFSTGKFSAL